MYKGTISELLVNLVCDNRNFTLNGNYTIFKTNSHEI